VLNKKKRERKKHLDETAEETAYQVAKQRRMKAIVKWNKFIAENNNKTQ
jgi:hypothetical protein